jgi:hypothetical protein
MLNDEVFSEALVRTFVLISFILGFGAGWWRRGAKNENR